MVTQESLQYYNSPPFQPFQTHCLTQSEGYFIKLRADRKHRATYSCFTLFPHLPIATTSTSHSLLSIVYAFRIQGQTAAAAAAQPRSFLRREEANGVGRRSQSCNIALKVYFTLSFDKMK